MEQNKIMLVYDNHDVLLVNLDNERCESKFEKSIKDDEKKICMLNNGNFLILNANKKMIYQYIYNKSTAIYTKYVRAHLNVIKLTTNERIIFGGDKIGNVYIWSAISGFLINTFQAHFGPIKDILIDQLVNVLYTYSDDNIVHVYNLHDLFRKKKIQPMLFYQHNINSNIKQIISITPNIYDTLYTLISLTNDGTIYVWGLKSKEAVHILKTQTECCTYICSNYPFNTHLYVCKKNKIIRIPFLEFNKKSTKNNKNKKNKKNSCAYCHNKSDDIKLKEYGDYVQIKKIQTEQIENDENDGNDKNDYNNYNNYNGNQNYGDINNDYSDYYNQSSDDNNNTNDEDFNDSHHLNINYLHLETNKIIKSQNVVTNEIFLNLKDFTTFIGHKSQVLKCYVDDKKQILISLASDGIKIWDIYNCYAIKTLKYGENVINFYIPTFKNVSYLIEFPNLVLEYEDNTNIHIIDEVKEHTFQSNYKNLLYNDQNLLINMANTFASHDM
ncbi:WD-repeat protein, putative [Plasmodium reichenowi]|uniref:WD-repeat protein, putative n=1 Tax=Plasmodium reichenowi TaxID=5854 RepID=A0A151L8X8_PLARE|nr:WD-repeat protein, putative [Plasmodium reichenowi]KYN95412.1 WD-repeat protein, putative [Plasmodium reichenowi]